MGRVTAWLAGADGGPAAIPALIGLDLRGAGYPEPVRRAASPFGRRLGFSRRRGGGRQGLSALSAAAEAGLASGALSTVVWGLTVDNKPVENLRGSVRRVGGKQALGGLGELDEEDWALVTEQVLRAGAG